MEENGMRGWFFCAQQLIDNKVSQVVEFYSENHQINWCFFQILRSCHTLICPLLAGGSFLGKQILTFVSAPVSEPVPAPALVPTLTKCLQNVVSLQSTTCFWTIGRQMYLSYHVFIDLVFTNKLKVDENWAKEVQIVYRLFLVNC